MNILIFANAFHLVSGGDKIFVEYGKRWADSRGVTVGVITNEKGKQFCLEHGMDPALITVWSGSGVDAWGALISSAYKSLTSFIRAIFSKPDIDVVFSASFIWPDLLPGLVMKLRNPHIRWVVASYVFVAPPWNRYYMGNRVNGIFLYAVQIVSLAIMRWLADGIFVASSEDVHRFTPNPLTHKPRIAAVRGGIDYGMFSNVPEQPLIYDCVHLGRFHPQKNIPQLLDIWQIVLRSLPSVRLMIAGAGSLEGMLRHRVASDTKLHKSVEFLGVLDGFEKAALYKSSAMYISATRFDSGILALDEALACGVPGVVYDLPQLDYPKGVVKVPVGDQDAFAEAIVDLLRHPGKRMKMAIAAKKFASTLNWSVKASQALKFIRSL